MEYQEFVQSKRHSSSDFGIDTNFEVEKMFDFQKYITDYAVKKGRAGLFVDTGLGKTLIELAIAKNYLNHTGKPVLIITPLAVAFQFIKEAKKFGIDNVSYSKNGKIDSEIVLCNYEKIDKFDTKNFDCVIADESSILKNFHGAIKTELTTFLKKTKYRFLATATPSPNDFIELGTSSEALGYLGYMDMIAKFFSNKENNMKAIDIGNKFYLKPHAKDDFFRWVSGWSLSMRKPSDLGFSDSNHILPELITNFHSVKNPNNQVKNGQIMLFNSIARSLPEVRDEQKDTIAQRCEKAVELASNYDTSVYWCNFNDEGDLLEKLDSNAVQIKGSMNIDKKEDILIAFSNGEIKKLITKSKMTGFGMNWQHCNHTVFFPTFSYEQHYQSIRRFWRFGQKKNVVCDMVFSDGQKRVIDILLEKSKKADDLFTKLNTELHNNFEVTSKAFDKEIILPNFFGV